MTTTQEVKTLTHFIGGKLVEGKVADSVRYLTQQQVKSLLRYPLQQ